jgi:hypothetical protein
MGYEPGLPTPSELKLLEAVSPKLAQEAKAITPKYRQIMDFAGNLFGNIRALKSSVDLSMGGRQGIFVAARHPIIWAKANIESVKYAKSTKYYDAEMKSMHGDKWGQLVDKYRKSLLTGGGAHEEAYAATDIFAGKTAKKLGAGHLIAGSERAYTGGLTKIRYELMKKNLRAYGNTAEEAEKNLGVKGMDGLLETVATLTGRGGKAGGFVEKHATTLQEALFSPRLWASRLQPLNPAFWKRIGPVGRKEAMESLGAFAAVAGTVLGAAVVAGADVETDPRSSDFLKIKVGDTRYDILGGFQQNLVFGARQITNSTKSSQSGRITQYGEGYGAPTRLSATADLVRNKANPVLGSAANIIEGKDKAGNKINPLAEIGSLFVPINIQGTYDAIRHENTLGEGLTKGVAKNLPDTFGISTQTYGIKDIKVTDKQKSTLKLLEQSGVPAEDIKSYKSFFQTLKTGPDRVGESENINKALAQNNTEQAQTIANEYNQKVLENLKSWLEANRGKQIPKAVYEALSSSLINLTSASIKSRLQSIVENPDKYNLKLGDTK